MPRGGKKPPGGQASEPISEFDRGTENIKWMINQRDALLKNAEKIKDVKKELDKAIAKLQSEENDPFWIGDEDVSETAGKFIHLTSNISQMSFPAFGGGKRNR